MGLVVQPCIKSIPRLEELNSRSQKLNAKVIGIACERKNDLFSPIHILQDLKVKYANFFINTNNKVGQEVINNLDILAFPTYILLNKNLKIIMRETNEDGLEKIENFFNKSK